MKVDKNDGNSSSVTIDTILSYKMNSMVIFIFVYCEFHWCTSPAALCTAAKASKGN